MSYYSVKLNWYESGSGLVEPVDVYDPTEKTMVLIDPVVTLTVGEAGNFEFTVPRNHVFYDKFKPYECSIAVFEEEDCIFFGRLLPPVLDVFGQKKFHAEGALAFLNDCILPPMEMGDQITVAEYIEQILGYYNQYASARPDREFVFSNLLSTDLANITIYDPQPWNYQSAKDIIVNYLYQYCGGYFYIEFTDFDELEFKWRYNLTEENDQVIQIGVNLLDLNQTGKEIYTAAIAKGGKDLDGEQVGMYSPVYTTANVVRYGLICKYLEYPSVTVVDALEAYCENFLSEQQFDGYTFEASAADQHPLTPTFKKYGIGQLVNLKAAELGVNVTIPITRIVYKLHTAVKEVTVGVSDARMRAISTASAKSEAKMEEMADEMECCSEDKQESTITGPDGNEYTLDVEVDPETGDAEVVAVKVLSKIAFTRSVISYQNGAQFDHTKYTVTGYYGDHTSIDVTEDCSFSIADGTVLNKNEAPKTLTATKTRQGASALKAMTPIVIKSGADIDVITGDSFTMRAGLSFDEAFPMFCDYWKIGANDPFDRFTISPAQYDSLIKQWFSSHGLNISAYSYHMRANQTSGTVRFFKIGASYTVTSSPDSNSVIRVYADGDFDRVTDQNVTNRNTFRLYLLNHGYEDPYIYLDDDSGYSSNVLNGSCNPASNDEGNENDFGNPTNQTEPPTGSKWSLVMLRAFNLS